jgi:hypothetical protein
LAYKPQPKRSSDLECVPWVAGAVRCAFKTDVPIKNQQINPSNYMKRTVLAVLASCGLVLAVREVSIAQGLPKTQLKMLTIMREEVKVGRAAEHG